MRIPITRIYKWRFSSIREPFATTWCFLIADKRFRDIVAVCISDKTVEHLKSIGNAIVV